MDNFEKVLDEMLARGDFIVGKTYYATVAHDSWCSFFEGRKCNCNPIIVLHDEKKES